MLLQQNISDFYGCVLLNFEGPVLSRALFFRHRGLCARLSFMVFSSSRKAAKLAKKAGLKAGVVLRVLRVFARDNLLWFFSFSRSTAARPSATGSCPVTRTTSWDSARPQSRWRASERRPVPPEFQRSAYKGWYQTLCSGLREKLLHGEPRRWHRGTRRKEASFLSPRLLCVTPCYSFFSAIEGRPVVLCVFARDYL